MKYSEYKLRMPNIGKVIEKLKKFTDDLQHAVDFSAAHKIFKGYDRYTSDFASDVALIQVHYSQDVTNKKIKKMIDKLDQDLPLTTEAYMDFTKAFLASAFLPDFEAKYGHHLIEIMETALRSQSPLVVEEEILLNQLESKYSHIFGTAMITFRDTKYTLPQMSQFTTSTDRATRKEASMAIAHWMSEHNEEIGAIYDQMVKTRDQEAKKLGYQNYIDLAYFKLGRTDYDQKMVAAYREQIKEVVVPMVKTIQENKKKRLGLDKLYFYDAGLDFNDGNPLPIGDPSELINKAEKMYHQMDPVAGDFFTLMKDSELLDVISRPGKTPGGFMQSFYRYKMPIVFANFNGTQGDVEVLTHEVGHALQYYLARNIKPSDYISPTLDACEMHSMSMEFLTWPYMESFFGLDTTKFKIAHLEGAISFLPYGALVDEFQHRVYENPNLTHTERMALWRDLERVYTPFKDYEDAVIYEQGALWIRQMHIFTSPFYYIDYTLAQIVAFYFLAASQKNNTATLKKYFRLCKLGGKFPFRELLEKANLPLPFTAGTIKKIMTPVCRILGGLTLS